MDTDIFFKFLDFLELISNTSSRQTGTGSSYIKYNIKLLQYTNDSSTISNTIQYTRKFTILNTIKNTTKYIILFSIPYSFPYSTQ